MREGFQRGTLPTLASLSSERSEVWRSQKARLASSPFSGKRGVRCYVCTEAQRGTEGGSTFGVAVMLTILQPTEEDSNSVAGI
ncbi:MAG: hypothetical protein ACYTXE_32495 [Nostoc sp.]